MNSPADIEIPLFEFFSALRQFDRQSLGRKGLGSEEFILVLEQLTQGYGQFSEADLYSLCKILWLKPYHSEQVFRHLFEKYLSDQLQRIKQERMEASKEKKVDQLPEQEKIEDITEKEQEDQSSKEDPKKKEEEESKNEADEKVEETPDEQEEHRLPETKQKAEFKNIFLDLKEGGSLPAGTEDPGEMSETLRNRIYDKPYKLQGTYFPLRSRLMQQSFQLIREVIREGRKTVVDWEATIDQVAREGLFKELAWKASPEIRSNLHILIDHEGSMIAFDDLTRAMVRALTTYTGKKNQVYYFRNYPVRLLYENEIHTRAIGLDQLFQAKPRSVIIVSDAGAARGHFNRERVIQTKAFIDNMRHHQMVWLNPMPEARWEDTTADYIHAFVPMYELNELGMVSAIKALKLKHRRR